ncbi:MAG: molecular chaperone TorD family protein [Epsilonproteobacteria bacterium]|nr:molecular chaperone TorD family protein [Campylobacterota bacterium]
MDKNTRVYIYAFLSRLFESEVDKKLLEDLKTKSDILGMIGEESFQWINESEETEVLEALSIDFTSLFLMNSQQPIESSIMDDKEEVLIGLQNPVMGFYFQNGFDLNLQNSKLQTPDHISIEFGFMQNVLQKGDPKTAYTFLSEHIMKWAPAYLLTIAESADTPFYRELCEFTTEFLMADFEQVSSEIDHES